MKFLWILMTILISVCVSGQATETISPGGSISGIITDLRSEAPLFGVDVKVMKDGVSLRFSARTDRDGKYSIKDVPEGVYDLKVSRNGYVPAVLFSVTVKVGEIITGKSIAIKLATPIQIGEEERNFTLTAVSGKTISLEDFKEKSVVVICIGNPYT